MNSRLGTVFHTKNNNYFYDSGTGRVINCSDNEAYELVEYLEGKLSKEDLDSDIRKFIEDNNLLRKPIDQRFDIPSKEEFKNLLKGNCEQIIIELTEDCNLRCGYCIYNEHHPDFRGFTKNSIKFNTAKETIDYLLNDYEGNEFSLTFYGGEPLIKFNLMKEIIDYTIDTYKNIKISVSFTTNLTLLTEEQIEYFKNIDAFRVSLMVSLDGPSSIHDNYRRDIKSRPTHNIVESNFKKLVSKFYNKEENRTISINCVLTPPYNVDKFDELDNYFYNTLNIPKDMNLNYTYVDSGNMIYDIDQDNEYKSLENYQVDKVKEDEKSYYPYLIAKKIYRMNNRRVTQNKDLIETIGLHGNCIPGNRRLYLQTDGNFRICEKTGNAVSIGDYKNGYYFDKIYKYYYEDYVKYFKDLCSNCWASDLCDICYDLVMDDKGIKGNLDEKLCPMIREYLKEDLSQYFEIIEHNPNYIEEILGKYSFS